MRGVAMLVAAACAGAGCDTVFNIDHVDDPGDAAIESSTCPKMLVHDEDGDGLDDSCDPCPFANDNVTDPDGDGITGQCDPAPMVANQRIMFSGFELASASDFLTNGGSIEGDTFHTTASAGSGTVFRTINVDHVWVIVGVDGISVNAQAAYHEIGIIFDAVQNGTDDLDGTYCVIGQSTDAYTEIYMHQDGIDMTVTGSRGSTAGVLDMVNGATILASFGHNDVPRLACSFRPPSASIGISGSGTNPPPPGGLALYTQNTEAKFRFVFVTTGS